LTAHFEEPAMSVLSRSLSAFVLAFTVGFAAGCAAPAPEPASLAGNEPVSSDVAPAQSGTSPAPRTRPAPPMSDPLPPEPVPESRPANPPTGSDSVAALDRSCRTSADCAVKNVGNCCGHMPACVNTNAKPDPDAVQAQCAKQGMASVCGFQEIRSCQCVQGQCEADNAGGMIQ
jgi:hypothetical protein